MTIKLLSNNFAPTKLNAHLFCYHYICNSNTFSWKLIIYIYWSFLRSICFSISRRIYKIECLLKNLRQSSDFLFFLVSASRLRGVTGAEQAFDKSYPCLLNNAKQVCGFRIISVNDKVCQFSTRPARPHVHLLIYFLNDPSIIAYIFSKSIYFSKLASNSNQHELYNFINQSEMKKNGGTDYILRNNEPPMNAVSRHNS